MPITHQIDELEQRLTFTIDGDVRGSAFTDHLCGLYGARPELCDYDCLFDMTSYCGDIGPQDINRLATLYAVVNPAARRPRQTLFVTPDVNFASWASVMDLQFPGRAHRVTSSLEQARLLLDERPAQPVAA